MNPFISKLIRAAILLAAPATAGIAAPPPPVAVIVAAPPPAAPPEPWPDAVPRLEVVSTPDWTNSAIYPRAALRKQQEGIVGFELWIGRDGVPRACRITASSGYAELDAGTCEVAVRMRFGPPRDEAGSNVETSFRRRVRWLISDPTPFGAARLTLRLALEGGAIVACTPEPSADVPREWMRSACPVIQRKAPYFLAQDRATARGATIVLQLVPTGESVPDVPPPPGGLVARRVVEFGLTPAGDFRDCRVTADQGFGPAGLEQLGPCDVLLNLAWLKPGHAAGSPATGRFELLVYRE